MESEGNFFLDALGFFFILYSFIELFAQIFDEGKLEFELSVENSLLQRILHGMYIYIYISLFFNEILIIHIL